MKYFVLALCVLLGASHAVPIQAPQASVQDLLTWLENVVEYEGKELTTKLVNVIKEVEAGVLKVKSLIPKVYEKIHQDADKVLGELKEIAKELEDFLAKKGGDARFGLGILDELTDLTGGTKLGTVMRVLQLAESAHKVCEDAKQFEPKLEKEMDKIQGIIGKHVDDLTTHVLKELGLNADVQKSIVKDIEELFEQLEGKAHTLILNLLRNIENTFDQLEKDLPEIYKVLEKRVEEIRDEMRHIIEQLKGSFQRGVQYGILDIAGSLTKGTSLGTVIRIVNVLDKFNVVVQDARGFGPHAEALLERSVDKVAASAQDFLEHAAELAMA